VLLRKWELIANPIRKDTALFVSGSKEQMSGDLGITNLYANLPSTVTFYL